MPVPKALRPLVSRDHDASRRGWPRAAPQSLGWHGRGRPGVLERAGLAGPIDERLGDPETLGDPTHGHQRRGDWFS